MMGIGISEMILIAGVALVVIGPEKFPDFAKIVLRTVRDLRGYVDDMKQEIDKEIRPIKKEIDEISRYDPEKYIDGLTGQSKTSDSAGYNGADPYQYDQEEYGYGEEDRGEPVYGGEEAGGGESEAAGDTVEPQPGEEHAENGYEGAGGETGDTPAEAGPDSFDIHDPGRDDPYQD
jgi:sec-independent protein translocase protein TatB